MDKIRTVFRRKSLKTSFAFYMSLCVLGAILSGLILSNLCQMGQSRIYSRYRTAYGYEASHIEIQDISGGVGTLEYHTEDTASHFTSEDRFFYDFLGFWSISVYPLCFVLCIAAASILFFRREIRGPLEMLDRAADNIAGNNLAFEVVSDRKNELGKLCLSFEKMRLALKENYAEMWRQMEERKRLNAAFSHDLRTPLTVLKGQSEMLVNYGSRMTPEKITATAAMMQRHIVRLETYVNMMNDLQRLEDIPVERKAVSAVRAAEQIRDTGEAVCGSYEFTFRDSMEKQSELHIDLALVMRVCENLLANAARYANRTVEVTAGINDDGFFLCVADDGRGFSAKDLNEATKPFYKASKETDNGHFGMGLNICKILCEKHGGSLRLENRGEGGASVTAVFQM